MILFYEESFRHDARQSVGRLADVNAAMVGGDAAKNRLQALQLESKK